MTLIDNITAILVFLILSCAAFAGMMGNIHESSRITQFSQVNEMQQRYINVIKQKQSEIVVDKHKEGFQSEMKSLFLHSFSGASLDISAGNSDNGSYSCYNTYLNNNSVFLGKKLTDYNVDYNDASLIHSNYRGETGTDYLNIMCFYNTYNYLRSGSLINQNDAPIAYVLYTFFEDKQFTKQSIANKGIVYFN